MAKTLRDEFAMAALNGLMQRNWSHLERSGDDAILETWVSSAYEIADRMMLHRDLPRVTDTKPEQAH